jgi:hypothetical protein
MIPTKKRQRHQKPMSPSYIITQTPPIRYHNTTQHTTTPLIQPPDPFPLMLPLSLIPVHPLVSAALLIPLVRQNWHFRGVGLRGAAEWYTLKSQLVSVVHGFYLCSRNSLSNRIDGFRLISTAFLGFGASVSARRCSSVCESLDWAFSRRRSSWCFVKTLYVM